MRLVASVSRYGREMHSVFDLLGTHEPALTAALRWTMGRSPALMRGTLVRLGLDESTDNADASVQLETADEAGRTDIEIFTPTAHVIIEAKQGWIVPGEVQLGIYAPRLNSATDAGLETAWSRCRTPRPPGRTRSSHGKLPAWQ